MKRASCLAAGAVLPLGLLLSCGGSGSGSSGGGGSSPTPAVANLQGNWLLTGTLPFATNGTPDPNSPFGLAVTITVAGSGLVVNGTAHLNCSASASEAFVAPSTGTAAANGTFTTTTPGAVSTSNGALTLTGTAPTSSDGSWSGTYTYVATPQCPTLQGNFTAQPIADFTGTYIMTADVLGDPLTNTRYHNVKFTFHVTQGFARASNVPFDKSALNVSTEIEGLPCATSGTNPAAGPGAIFGESGLLSQTLNDGSSLNVVVNLQDADAAQATSSGAYIIGYPVYSTSTCGSLDIQPKTPLIRQ